MPTSMTHLGAWILAVCALAISAGSASAATFEAEEGKELFGVKVTIEAEGQSKFHSPSIGITVTCNKESGSAVIEGSNLMEKYHSTYSECTGTGSNGESCGTAQSGTTPGVIKLNTMIGYAQSSKQSATEAALLFETESASSVTSIKFEKEFGLICFSLGVTGKVVGELAPVEVFTTEGKLIFAESETGEQAITKVGGGETTYQLMGFGAPLVLISSQKLHYAENIRVAKR